MTDSPKELGVAVPAPSSSTQLENLQLILQELRKLTVLLGAPEKELLAAPEASALCSSSTASWHRGNASGLIPRPLKIGGLVRWSRRELMAWIEHGCPPRQQWNVIWEELKKRSK
jgi:prophage regulatory protein